MENYKKPKFKPMHLFRRWLIDILYDSVKDGNAVLDQFEGFSFRFLSDVRDCIKHIKKPYLYKHAAYILERKTGVLRPTISDEKIRLCEILFRQVLEAKFMLDIRKKTYYPFYIYKIFDHILTDPEERRILNYIHLPENHKIEDLQWNKIMEVMPYFQAQLAIPGGQTPA